MTHSIEHLLIDKSGSQSLNVLVQDGSTISPFVIFTGKTLSQDWIPSNVDDSWRFSVNTQGWTSNNHALEWLRHCFEPMTREKANGRTRVLIYDGHGSHVQGQFLEQCLQNKIHILLLPPHTRIYYSHSMSAFLVLSKLL
jgi:DDE superfamily endonuclease.